jgi:hypothetical protein
MLLITVNGNLQDRSAVFLTIFITKFIDDCPQTCGEIACKDIRIFGCSVGHCMIVIQNEVTVVLSGLVFHVSAMQTAIPSARWKIEMRRVRSAAGRFILCAQDRGFHSPTL